MKFGLQTISWGQSLRDENDMREVARFARKMGYMGLEFAQQPNCLPSPTRLYKILAEEGLEAIGFCGGSLDRRLEYVGNRSISYLYADTWDLSSIQRAIACERLVALHPHYLKPMSLNDALSRIDFDPRLGLLLDTAHLYLCGNDFVEAIKKNLDVLVGIHLKDWSDHAGRSPFDYARGFTALGKGCLGDGIRESMSILAAASYCGWIVIEQDNPDPQGPCHGATISQQWLKANGFWSSEG